MTEALAAIVAVPEEIVIPEEAETKGKTKTNIITAAALGAVGLGAAYAESRGVIHGWPPPFHSLKHPWLGYYAAWGVNRVQRYRTATAVAAGIGADVLTESAQDMVNSQDGYPFHWLELHNGGRSEDDLGNLIDLAACMGGSALFLAQNRGVAGWTRQSVSRLRTKLPGNSAAPALRPIE